MVKKNKSYRDVATIARSQCSTFESNRDSMSAVSSTVGNGSFGGVMSLIAEKKYDAALKILGKPSGEEVSSNTIGVCLMRAGRAKEAVDLFRRLVLLPGSTLVRENVNPVFVRNYAVALVLTGLPGAVKVLLGELPERNHPMALQILQAIKAWSKTLPLLRRLDWIISGISPENCVIPLDFEPGELFFHSQPHPLQRDASAIAPGTLAG